MNPLSCFGAPPAAMLVGYQHYSNDGTPLRLEGQPVIKPIGEPVVQPLATSVVQQSLGTDLSPEEWIHVISVTPVALQHTSIDRLDREVRRKGFRNLRDFAIKAERAANYLLVISRNALPALQQMKNK